MVCNLHNILAQPDANQPVTRYVWMMTISVKGHTLVIHVCGRCAEVWRGFVIAPRITLLVTAARVTRNEETGEEGRVTDQQFIRISVVCTHAVPQSIRASNISIIVSGRYRHLVSPFEGEFLSGLVINEHYFRELQDKSEYVCIKITFGEKSVGQISFCRVSFFRSV